MCKRVSKMKTARNENKNSFFAFTLYNLLWIRRCKKSVDLKNKFNFVCGVYCESESSRNKMKNFGFNF